MKKYILIFLGFTFLVGCEKDLLDQTNPNTLTPDIFWQSEADATAAIIGTYSPLSTIFYHGRIWYMVEMSNSDEIFKKLVKETTNKTLILSNHKKIDLKYFNKIIIFGKNEIIKVQNNKKSKFRNIN